MTFGAASTRYCKPKLLACSNFTRASVNGERESDLRMIYEEISRRMLNKRHVCKRRSILWYPTSGNGESLHLWYCLIAHIRCKYCRPYLPDLAVHFLTRFPAPPLGLHLKRYAVFSCIFTRKLLHMCANRSLCWSIPICLGVVFLPASGFTKFFDLKILSCDDHPNYIKPNGSQFVSAVPAARAYPSCRSSLSTCAHSPSRWLASGTLQKTLQS